MRIGEEMENLVQEIASSRGERAERLRELRGETGRVMWEARELVKDFRTSREETGARLREDLARDKADRSSEVKTMLDDAQRARREMGDELREDLARDKADRSSEVKTMLDDAQRARREMGDELREDLAQARADRESEVRGLLAEVRADLKRAADAWQELGPHKKAAEVRVEAKVESPEEREEWEERLLAAIKRHPEGVTLSEVAKDFGVVPVVLGRAVSRLRDQGKIRKRKNSYFPVTEGGLG